MKGKGQKEDEKKKDEDESKPQQETVVDEAWSLPYDAAFHNLLKEASESISPLQDEVKMYTALAMWVFYFFTVIPYSTSTWQKCDKW